MRKYSYKKKVHRDKLVVYNHKTYEAYESSTVAECNSVHLLKYLNTKNYEVVQLYLSISII